jgi:hypothetical protein
MECPPIKLETDATPPSSTDGGITEKEGVEMQKATYEAVAEKIANIQADPIGWAKRRNAEIAEVYLPGQPTRDLSTAELADFAAEELTWAQGIIANAVIDDPQPTPSEWATVRTRRAIEELES